MLYLISGFLGESPSSPQHPVSGFHAAYALPARPAPDFSLARLRLGIFFKERSGSTPLKHYCMEFRDAKLPHKKRTLRGSFFMRHLLGESNPRCRDENPVS